MLSASGLSINSGAFPLSYQGERWRPLITLMIAPLSCHSGRHLLCVAVLPRCLQHMRCLPLNVNMGVRVLPECEAQPPSRWPPLSVQRTDSSLSPCCLSGSHQDEPFWYHHLVSSVFVSREPITAGLIAHEPAYNVSFSWKVTGFWTPG